MKGPTLRSQSIREHQAFFAGAPTGARRVVKLRSGPPGMQQLVDRLQASVQAAGKTDLARELAVAAISNVHPNDIRGQVKAVYDFVADDPQLSYVKDPVDLQVIPSLAAATSGRKIDCKGKTIVAAGLLESIGIRCRVVTVDQRIGAPGPAEDHHVYAEWFDEATGRWIPIDPVMSTIRKSGPGDELAFKRKTVHRRQA